MTTHQVDIEGLHFAVETPAGLTADEVKNYVLDLLTPLHDWRCRSFAIAFDTIEVKVDRRRVAHRKPAGVKP